MVSRHKRNGREKDFKLPSMSSNDRIKNARRAIPEQPKVVKSDNGPPFNRNEFAKFAEAMGFKHYKITPKWPQANGMNERFMKNLTSIITKARIENKKWRDELREFLRMYRFLKDFLI